jgi:hypothetical protein
MMSDEQETNRQERQEARKSRALLPPSLLGTTEAGVPEMTKNEEVAPGDQLLVGAARIRAWLGLKNEKQVYNLRDRTEIPIFPMPGVGLAARKPSLEAWISRLEEEDLARRRRRRTRKI